MFTCLTWSHETERSGLVFRDGDGSGQDQDPRGPLEGFDISDKSRKVPQHVCAKLPVSLCLFVSTYRSRHRSKFLLGRPGQLLLLQHESRSHEETATQHLLLQVHTHKHTLSNCCVLSSSHHCDDECHKLYSYVIFQVSHVCRKLV